MTTAFMLIALVIIALEAIVIWSYASENTRLRKHLDTADNNDGRDAKGRYSGSR